MGFTPEQSAEALLHCNSLEQATEWIVNHPSTPAAAPPSDANVTDVNITCLDIDLQIIYSLKPF